MILQNKPAGRSTSRTASTHLPSWGALRLPADKLPQPKPTLRRLTANLKQRLTEHNSGKLPHTAQFKPWHLITYVAFSDKQKAAKFERYLKSGSGHAFANRRLW